MPWGPALSAIRVLPIVVTWWHITGGKTKWDCMKMCEAPGDAWYVFELGAAIKAGDPVPLLLVTFSCHFCAGSSVGNAACSPGTGLRLV